MKVASMRSSKTVRETMGLHVREPSSSIYRLQSEIVENAPLDEGIYSDSNDSLTFDNKNDTHKAGQQKLLHQVKVLDDHLENLKCKLSQMKVEAEEQQFLNGFIENRVELSDRDNKQAGSKQDSNWDAENVTASKFITETRQTETVQLHCQHPSADSGNSCKIPAEFINVFNGYLGDIERMKQATESVLKFSVICQREMDNVIQENQTLKLSLETARSFENQHNQKSSHFEDHLGSMEKQVDQLKKENELQRLDNQRFRQQLYQERQIRDNVMNEHSQQIRQQMNELKEKLVLCEQEKEQLQYQYKNDLLQYQHQGTELKATNKRLEEEVEYVNYQMREQSKELEDKYEEIRWLEDQVEIKKQEKAEIKREYRSDIQELIEKLAILEEKCKKQKKQSQKEKKELKKSIRELRQRERDTLALFGIDVAASVDLDDVTLGSPTLPPGNSRSASLLSLDRQNNRQPLRDVIEEEFSQEELQADQSKLEQTSAQQSNIRVVKYAEMKKSVSQLPPSHSVAESIVVAGSGSVIEGKASSLSRSQNCTPRPLQGGLEAKEKLSFDEIRRILLTIHRQGSGVDTPVSSRARRNNDLILLGENEAEWQQQQKQRQAAKKNVQVNVCLDMGTVNDRNSLDGSSNFMCNLSNLRSIEKRISAHKNGTIVSQSMNKTFMESNVDVLDCLDDVSKFSQSQIFGQITGIPQLSGRKDKFSNLDENTLRQIIQFSASVREKREFVEYKNLLIEEQNNLRVNTAKDEDPASAVNTSQVVEATGGANELTSPAIKKSNSPHIKDENQLQLKHIHNRNLTIAQGKKDPEQVPSSPIKKFLFVDKAKNPTIQKSKSELQESDGQEESKRLLFGNDENGKPIALQQTLKKSKSSFDNDGYQKVKVVDLEYEKFAREPTDSEEEDDGEDAEESDILTDEKQQVITSSSPKQLEKIKSLSQSITEHTRQVLTKINSELNSAQEKNSVVIYQSQCQASISSPTGSENSIKIRRKSKNNRRSFQEKRGLLIQTSQRKLRALQQQDSKERATNESGQHNSNSKHTVNQALQHERQNQFQFDQQIFEQDTLANGNGTFGKDVSGEAFQYSVEHPQAPSGDASSAAMQHYNNWMANKTISGGGVTTSQESYSIKKFQKKKKIQKDQQNYKNYVSPALGAKRNHEAVKTELGFHHSNKPSLQMSPMVGKQGPPLMPKTTRNVGMQQRSNQRAKDGHSFRKCRPATGQNFIQTPLSSTRPVMVRSQLQNDGQFAMDNDQLAEKHQMFINKLHKSKNKWERYHEVLTNDTCFNVNHLKQKYNIKEQPAPNEKTTPSVASSGTKMSFDPSSQQKHIKQSAQHQKLIDGFNAAQVQKLQKGKTQFKTGEKNNTAHLTIPDQPATQILNKTPMTRTMTGFASQSSHGLMEVFCGRKQQNFISSMNKTSTPGIAGATQMEMMAAGHLRRRNSSRMSGHAQPNSQLNFFKKLRQCGVINKSNSQLQLRLSHKRLARPETAQDQHQVGTERYSGISFGYQGGRTTFGMNAHNDLYQNDFNIDFRGQNQPVNPGSAQDLISFRQDPNLALIVHESAMEDNFQLRQRKQMVPMGRNSERHINSEKENNGVADFYQILHPSSQPTLK